MTNKRLYNQFLNRNNISRERVLRDIGKSKDFLYRKAANLTEDLIKVRLKALNPNLASSFSFNTDAQMAAAAVYILLACCIT